MSIAAAMKPKSIGLGGGWLSMAPQMDEDPVPSTSSNAISSSSTYSPPLTSSQHDAAVHSSSKAASSFSGYHHARPRTTVTAPSRLLPRTTARFKVGDSSALATPSSPAPESPYSRGSEFDSPPPFDVRASFAPMPKWGGVGIHTNNKVSQEEEMTVIKASDGVTTDNDLDLDVVVSEDDDFDRSYDHSAEENRGILHAGIQWKGKTAHAVEQEMEALGDRTVMSYAPDAVYLASRLEGLKRNLEVGGERLKRWAWEDFEDEEVLEPEKSNLDDLVEARGPPLALIDNEVETEVLKTDNIDMPNLEQRTIDSVVSSLSVSEGITPNDEVLDDPMQESMGSLASATGQNNVDILTDIPRISINETAAKDAALDARVEIRTLRRPDLEQVRELHCFHGDTDKVDTETYTTSAGFLLRLLVDEHHVCLVAVAKPLPEPPSLPTRFSPGAPPPSLDMPPSKSPFLVAGQSGQVGLSFFRKHSSKLAPLTHSNRLLVEATAPRSFGVGGDSSSSLEDETEIQQQDNLFEAAKLASTSKTEQSSPETIAEEEDEGDDVAVFQGFKLPETYNEKDEEEEEVSISPKQDSVLAGPTHDVAPPRAIRIMGAPPLNGMPIDSETILGVASARIKVVQRSEGDDAFGKSEALDSSWPGLDPKGEKSMVTREVHIITLSVLPGERGQGLGARLLDHLLDECKRRTAGPRIHLASGSNTFNESGTAPRVHENAPMRTFLEVHPTNTLAIRLYQSRQFTKVEGSKGVVKHYFRGDNRIPNSIRVKVGGSDAIRLERFDFK